MSYLVSSRVKRVALYIFFVNFHYRSSIENMVTFDPNEFLFEYAGAVIYCSFNYANIIFESTRS